MEEMTDTERVIMSFCVGYFLDVEVKVVKTIAKTFFKIYPILYSNMPNQIFIYEINEFAELISKYYGCSGGLIEFSESGTSITFVKENE